jgi:hypothetical protein
VASTGVTAKSGATVHVTLTTPDALVFPAATLGKTAKAAIVTVNNASIIEFFMGLTSHSKYPYLKYISEFFCLD